MTTSPRATIPCPHCAHPTNRMVDSRGTAELGYIRRRRECAGCEGRFSTIEIDKTTYEVLTAKSAKWDQLLRDLQTQELR